VGLLYIFSTPLDLVELDLVAFPVRSPTAIVGGLFIAMWVFDLARRNASLPKHGRVLVSGILFVFWSALTTAWSVAPDVTVSTSLSTVVLLLSAVAIGTVFASIAPHTGASFLMPSLLQCSRSPLGTGITTRAEPLQVMDLPGY
jgi:hypothetical protein